MFPALPSPEPHLQVDEYDCEPAIETVCAHCGYSLSSDEAIDSEGDLIHPSCAAKHRLGSDLAAMVAIVNGGAL